MNKLINKTVREILLSKNLKQQQTPSVEKSKITAALAEIINAEEVLAQQYAGTRYKG